MQPFTVLCVKFHTVLYKKLATVNGSPKILRAFSTKLYAHKIVGLREFKTIF